MGIDMTHQMNNVLNLIGGDYRMQQAHLLAAVASVSVQNGDPVAVLAYIRLYYLVRVLRSYLERHPFVAMVKLSMVFVEINWNIMEYPAYSQPNR